MTNSELFKHTHVHRYSHARARAHAHAHTHMHARTHAHTHARTHAHTHTHTGVAKRVNVPGPLWAAAKLFVEKIETNSHLVGGGPEGRVCFVVHHPPATDELHLAVGHCHEQQPKSANQRERGAGVSSESGAQMGTGMTGAESVQSGRVRWSNRVTASVMFTDPRCDTHQAPSFR